MKTKLTEMSVDLDAKSDCFTSHSRKHDRRRSRHTIHNNNFKTASLVSTSKNCFIKSHSTYSQGTFTFTPSASPSSSSTSSSMNHHHPHHHQSIQSNAWLSSSLFMASNVLF